MCGFCLFSSVFPFSSAQCTHPRRRPTDPRLPPSPLHLITPPTTTPSHKKTIPHSLTHLRDGVERRAAPGDVAAEGGCQRHRGADVAPAGKRGDEHCVVLVVLFVLFGFVCFVCFVLCDDAMSGTSAARRRRDEQRLAAISQRLCAAPANKHSPTAQSQPPLPSPNHHHHHKPHSRRQTRRRCRPRRARRRPGLQTRRPPAPLRRRRRRPRGGARARGWGRAFFAAAGVDVIFGDGAVFVIDSNGGGRI